MPSLYPTIPISIALTMGGQTTRQQQKTKQTQKQSLQDIQRIGSLTMPKMSDIVTPKSIQSLSPIQTPTQEHRQIQIPKIASITLPKMDQISIQTPVITPFIDTPTPPFQPSLRVTAKPEPKKKKKKTSGKKRKTAYEKRKDPLRITFPNVKMPKFKVPKI